MESSRRAFKRYSLSLWKYDKRGRPRYFSTLPRWGTNDYQKILSVQRDLDKIMGDIFEIRISDIID